MMIQKGFNTSEFWITLIQVLGPWVTILGLLLLVAFGRADLVDLQWFLIALGVGGGLGNIAAKGYSANRTTLKQTEILDSGYVSE